MAEVDNKRMSNKFTVVYLIVLAGFVAVLACVLKLQTIDRQELLSLEHESPARPLPAMRGNIYSCNGELMASTVPYYNIYMDVQTDYLKTHKKKLLEDIDSLSWHLSHKFGEKSTAEYRRMILNAYNTGNRRLSLCSRSISYDELKAVQKFPLFRMGAMRGGLISEKHVMRVKPFGSLAARTIGDIYGDQFNGGGRSGLELAYDSILRGQPGVSQRQHLGKYIADVTLEDPEDGLDLTTTIDIEMQDIAESVFRAQANRFSPEKGCVVLMEVATGEIKACVNLKRDAEGNYREIEDIAFTSRPEPGSTFKTMSMMVALENGVVKIDDQVNTGEGEWNMHGRKMTDTHKNGVLTMTEVLAKSSNIGMSRVIDDYYKDKPGEYVDALYKMGVGKPMNICYPGAATPSVRHPNDKGKKWSKTTLPWMSIGYETGMPPIYTLAFYNAIANDGKYIKPFLVKSINKNGRVIKNFHTETINSKICSSHTLRDIRTMLRAVVTTGTAKSANSPYVTLAGKTGTAQTDYWIRGAAVRHNITFCGYFPAEKPLYSIIVVMFKPVEPSDAGTMCAPVARRIAERIYAQKMQNPLAKNFVTGEVPTVKAGESEAIAEALDELDFDYTDNSALWSRVRHENEYDFIPVKMTEGRVPNVVGMAAKDAVYLLEKCGLRVIVCGTGRVQSQSIAADELVVKGKTVVLVMK